VVFHKIEVSFELDVNGILTVVALDKSTGKSEQVTVEKGRLSEEEIQKMLHDAEEMAEEDKKLKERVTARHQLENFVYSVRNQLKDEEGIKSKLTEEETEEIEKVVKEAIAWLDDNMQADKDDYEQKREEIEKIIHPIMSKYAGGAPGDAGDDTMPGHDDL